MGGGSASRGEGGLPLWGLPPWKEGDCIHEGKGVCIQGEGGLHLGWGVGWPDPLPPPELEKLTVCILLECFLVAKLFSSTSFVMTLLTFFYLGFSCVLHEEMYHDDKKGKIQYILR